MITFIFGCDETTSGNGSSGVNSNITTIKKSDAIGKWILVGSDYIYNPTGADLEAEYFYEYESKFFLPYTGDIPPSDWPTTEQPFDDYLFL